MNLFQKKILTLICTFVLICTAVCAAPAGMHSVPTDIRVTIHGAEIPAVCVNNSMYIAAEDLGFYGYGVAYDNSVRTLFVNKITSAAPTAIKYTPSAIKCTLDTDIKVYLNGEQVDKNATFAYDGKMWLNVTSISRYRDGNNTSDPGTPGYPHLLTSTWDGEKRLIAIDDAPMISAAEQRAKLLSYGGKREEYSTFLAFTETSYPGDGFEIVSLRVGGLPHGSATQWYYIADSGRFYCINTVTAPYALHNYWGNSEIKNARVEGNRFYFESMRMLNREPVVKTVYGQYYLDLDTTAVTVISEKEG